MTAAAEQLRQDIRAALKAQHVRQVELARRTGLTPKHVSQTLTGVCGISLDVAERMAAALNLTLTARARPKETPRMAAQQPSRYGQDFDAIADRWARFESEHDLVHPNRSDCGGLGGCQMMAHAHDLTVQLEDILDKWRLTQ